MFQNQFTDMRTHCANWIIETKCVVSWLVSHAMKVQIWIKTYDLFYVAFESIYFLGSLQISLGNLIPIVECFISKLNCVRIFESQVKLDYAARTTLDGFVILRTFQISLIRTACKTMLWISPTPIGCALTLVDHVQYQLLKNEENTIKVMETF